jgi:hypothetical protein
MKVIEVQFDGHVKVPDAQRGTNVLRVTGDVAIGGSVLVDLIEEKTNGVLVTKKVDKDGKYITFRKLYSWNRVNEVLYEPEVVVKPVEDPKVLRK